MIRRNHLTRARQFQAADELDGWLYGHGTNEDNIQPAQSATVYMRTGDSTQQPGPQALHLEPKSFVVRFQILRASGVVPAYNGPPPVAGAVAGPPVAPTISSIVGSDFYCAARATIIMTVDGVQMNRVIDVQDGTSFTGVASGITVFLQDRTFPGDSDANFGQQYIVKVQIAEGVRGSYDLPPTLIGVADEDSAGFGETITILAGNQAHYKIPQNCGVISVKVDCIQDSASGEATEPNVRCDFQSGPLPTTWKSFNPFLAGASAFVNVPPQANVLVISNDNPAEGVSIDITVTWGIEG